MSTHNTSRSTHQALLARPTPATAPPDRPPSLRLRGLTKRYGAVAAVRGVDLDVAPSEMVALLGPNGAGKTTTVRMLVGLTSPDEGSVEVLGRPPREAVAAGLIAVMLQDAGLMPGITVAEQVQLGRRMYADPMPLAEALALAGLTGLERRRVDRLSGGQAQRVRFALAVVGNPAVLVLDEPTAALDLKGRLEFWSAMRGYAATGRTLLFTTHYLEEVDQNAERIVVIGAGRVIADGTPGQIRKVAGASTVRFTVAGAAADPSALRALPGVVDLDIHGRRVTARTHDPDATVRALTAGDLPWHDLAVSEASLDDAFLTLSREER